LCWKNDSAGETEPAAGLAGRLFSFQSKDFLDELNLPILGKLVYRQLDLDIRRNRLYH